MAASQNSRVLISELDIPVSLNLRVRAEGVEVAEQTLECPLPQPLWASSAPGGLHVLWLGPDEFLVVGLQGQVPDLTAAGSVVDVSANRTAIQLTGSRAQDVLEKGIQIDLSYASAPILQCWCAQTLLAGVPIILWRTEDAWILLVRPSFANYVADWLLDAMLEFTP